MNSVDRFAIKGILFLCLPLLAFTLYEQRVEDKEMSQVERQKKPACFTGDFVCEMTAGTKYASMPVVLFRREK